MSIIEPRLNDIGHGSQICASVRVDNTLGPRRGARRERNSQHIVFVRSMAMQICPTLGALFAIVRQTFQNGSVIRTCLGSIAGIGVLETISQTPFGVWKMLYAYIIDNQRNLRVIALISTQEALKLLVDDDTVNVGEVEDVFDIVLLEAVIGRYHDSSSSNDAIDSFEEGGRVRRQNSYALESMLLQVVGQTSCLIGELLVGTANGDSIGSDMQHSVGIRLNCGCALEEESWRQVVNV